MEQKKDARPKCYRCKWMCLADYGYSDYTVEGTDVRCLKDGFENRDKAYDSDEKAMQEEGGFLEYSSNRCGEYEYGKPLELNVDCDQEEAISKRLGEKK